MLRVSREVIEGLNGRGIEVMVERTSKAVSVYNGLQKGKTVIAALHITC